MTKVGEIVKEITAKPTGNGNGNGKEKESKMPVPANTVPEPVIEAPKPEPAPKKEMTLQEKIQRIETQNTWEYIIITR